MKAVVINQYGGKEELKEVDYPKPLPGQNQVVIDIHATSINPIDWKLREGYLKEMLPFHFPIILGWDAAGVVTDIGEHVTKFDIGDKVFTRPATTEKGTYAEYIAVEEDLIAKMPNNMTFEEAASIPLAGLTAWQCLVDSAKVSQGDKVLIHAGAGGVGSLAIQIAKSKGATVATTGSGKNRDYLLSLGADLVINYENEDFSEIISDYDIVLDTMGGDIQEKSFSVLRLGGKLVSIVAPPNEEKAKEKGVLVDFVWLQPNGEELEKLAQLIEEEKLKAQVGEVFDFNEEGLKEAHALSESHHAKGKIVIKMK